jgi:hypothetical protein
MKNIVSTFGTPGRKQNALRDPQIPPDEKHMFSITCPDTLFMETTPGPPEHEKLCVDVSHPIPTEMDYVTRRSHRKEEHQFGVTCPDVLLVESTPVLRKYEKLLVDVSRPRRTEMHYVTSRSHECKNTSSA